MRTKILALAFAAALLMAMALPFSGGAGTTLATHEHDLVTPGTTVEDIASGQTSNDGNGCHRFHDNVHKGVPGDNNAGLGVFDPGEGAFDQAGRVTIVGAALILCP